MNEWPFVWMILLKLPLIGFFVVCYVIGGRGEKWVRRFLGGIGFGSGIILISLLMHRFNWWLLALPAAYPIALSVGYGSDTFWGKVAKRGFYGLIFGLIGLYAGFFLNIYLGIVQLILPVIVCVFLGVFNPTRAVDEEAMIALALIIHVPFML